MFKNNKILTIIPARGGSKGIKLKNLKKINNISLTSLAIKAAKKSKFIDRIIVSTDHKKIINEAKKNNLFFNYLRPKKLSGDLISDHEVLKDCLVNVENEDRIKYDIILMLQPTSPERKTKHINECIKRIVEKKLDSVWTVSKVDLKFNPYKQLKIINNKLSFFHKDGSKIIARQQLNKTYIRNGLVYAMSRNCILKKNSILGNKSEALIVNGDVVNIDSNIDLIKARIRLSTNAKL